MTSFEGFGALEVEPEFDRDRLAELGDEPEDEGLRTGLFELRPLGPDGSPAPRLSPSAS